MGCFVPCVKRSMRCFVRDDRSLWDVLSVVSSRVAIFVDPLTEIFGLWLIPAALELQYCGSRAATTCGSRAALKYFVCKLVFPL